MIHPFHWQANRPPLRMRWFLGVAWMLVLAKCTLIWWAIVHWHVPFHPAWIVLPTLLFAALASVLWVTSAEE